MVFFIPFGVIIILIAILFALGYKALEINLAPILAIIFLIFVIIGIVKAISTLRESESEYDNAKSIVFAIFALMGVFMFLAFCFTSCTVGDVLKTVWFAI